MEEGVSSVGQVPESPASALSPRPPTRGSAVPTLPPLAIGRARMARVALRRLSADVAQSLTLISQRGIDCLIAIDAGHSIVHSGSEAFARGTFKRDGVRGNVAQGWRLRLSAGVAQPLRDACDREAILDWSGARMRLLYRNAAALSWLAARLNIDSDMPLDDISAQSLRGAAFDDVIARLALTGLGAPHIVEDRPLSAAARRVTSRESTAFSFVVLLHALDSAKPTILAVLEADAFGVNLLAALLQHRAERPNDDAARASSEPPGSTAGGSGEGVAPRSGRCGLPMVTRVVLPSVHLPIADVRALSVGDVVLLGVPRRPAERSMPAGASPRASHDAAGGRAGLHARAADGLGGAENPDKPEDILPGYLEVGGRTYWRVAVMQATAAADSGYVRLINREFGVADDGMDDVNNGANDTNRFAAGGARLDGGGAGAAWTDHVPVRVTFELGTKTVPLVELQRWREGSVLTFQPPFTQCAASETSIVRTEPSTDDMDAEDAEDDERAYDTDDTRVGGDGDDISDAHDGSAAYDEGDALDRDDEAGNRDRHEDDTRHALHRHDTTSMREGAKGAVAEDRPTVTVRIRVNGAPLGIGELVDIDGQLGVSIVTLFAGGAGASSDETNGCHGEALP